MKKLLFGLIATIMVTFTVKAQGNLRADFLKGKTKPQTIESFNILSTQQKSDLWIEKMDQLLSLRLPERHYQLINEMKNSHSQKDLNNFKNTTLELAKITPEEDFTQMFFSLDDYEFNGTFVGRSPISNETLKQINEVGLSKEVVTGKLKKCNCDWLCDFYAGGNQGNCKPTTSGCGFLWAFDCTGYVGPNP